MLLEKNLLCVLQRRKRVEKKKKLVSSIFLQRPSSSGLLEVGFCDKDLILYNTIQTVNDLEAGGFLNILWEKEKILINNIYTPANEVFLGGYNGISLSVGRRSVCPQNLVWTTPPTVAVQFS